VRSPPPEEEGAAKTTCDELTATPIPSSCSACGDKVEKTGSEVEPEKKRRVGEGVFNI